MRRKPTSRSRILIAVLATALGLLLAAAALAARPTPGGTYAGNTAAPAVNGFRGPVTFTVSTGGTNLLRFQYGNIGCIPGGAITGNPYTSAAAIIKVGTIPVAAKGHFSLTGATSTYVNTKGGKTTTVTTSAVAGKFKTAKTAAGTITFTQHLTGVGGFSKSCGPLAMKFTAKTK
jgi:hypothetical protein